MELCSGGELFDEIAKRNEPLSEKEAAQIIYKILQSINHAHS